MKILGQKLIDGSVTVFDAPDPAIADGFIRVKTLFSVISAGTEGGKVITGKYFIKECRVKSEWEYG